MLVDGRLATVKALPVTEACVYVDNTLQAFPGQSLSRTDVSWTSCTKEFHLFSCTRLLTPGSVNNSTGYRLRTGKLPPVFVTSHSGQLSLLSSAPQLHGRWVPAKVHWRSVAG